jgi:hypothetical protein
MNGKAILFGLNYKHCKSGQLNGCINDVNNMAVYIKNELKIPIDIYTDDVNLKETSGIGITNKLFELACNSYRYNYDFVYIHYSGHGSYVTDYSKDESDGKDEALVPSDYETKGFLVDDYLQTIFRQFNPRTKIFCVFDCCHSGTLIDTKYRWESENNVKLENIRCQIKAKVITISGCLDDQTSADAYNLLKDGKYTGALTTAILSVFKEKPYCKNNIFELLGNVRMKLKNGNFSQIPIVCSTYNLTKDTRIF